MKCYALRGRIVSVHNGLLQFAFAESLRASPISFKSKSGLTDSISVPDIFVCDIVEVPESGDEVFEEPLDDGEEFVVGPLPQQLLSFEDAPVTSRSIPIALSLFSLSCNAGKTFSPSHSFSLLSCNRLREVPVVKAVVPFSAFTFSLRVNDCLDLGVDVV